VTEVAEKFRITRVRPASSPRVGSDGGELIRRLADRIEERSRAVPLWFERNLGPLLAGWVLVAGCLFALRAGFPATPYSGAADL